MLEPAVVPRRARRWRVAMGAGAAVAVVISMAVHGRAGLLAGAGLGIVMAVVLLGALRTPREATRPRAMPVDAYLRTTGRAADAPPALSRIARAEIAPVDPRRQEWVDAVRRFDALRDRYAAYECDALAVLRLPALADVTVPATARFVDAFAEAQALRTDRCPPGRHGDRFVAAVETAEHAHTAALDVAKRIRLSTFAPGERRTVERVVKLLGVARHTDNIAERHLAYVKAHALLAALERDGAMQLPAPAAARLATAVRPARLALPAGRGAS